MLYRGIAARAFERAFQLADFVLVKNASLENGLLHVDLVREISRSQEAPQHSDHDQCPGGPSRRRHGSERSPRNVVDFTINAKTPRETGAYFF